MLDQTTKPGLLLRQNNGKRQEPAPQLAGAGSTVAAKKPGQHALAFAGVYIFTLLLYLRPNELFPGIFGSLAIVKFVAIATFLAYVMTKLSNSERLTVLPIEIKMVLVITALSIILIPTAAAPQESIEMLNDTFLKVVLIFILMVNLLDTRARMLSIIKLVLIGGVWITWGAIKSYRAGEFAKAAGGFARIEGYGGGMFGNPNDLATALDLLLPLAVVMGLNQKGILRYVYFGFAALFGVGVMITFSRGGFLGLFALGIVLVWKLGSGKRLQAFAATLFIFMAFSMAVPGGYGVRMFTIFNPAGDSTGSAQIRSEVLQRGAIVALAHPIGVGMANFHMFSRSELRAHNSYIEISGELGMLGLIAYMILQIAPMRALGRIERETRGQEGKEREIYYLSVGLQATLAAYLVCSFFSSIQYYWYLYYPVAYAIALRTIHDRESSAGADTPSEETDAGPGGTKGTLRQSRHGRGGALWPVSDRLTSGIKKVGLKRRPPGRVRVT